MAQFPPPQPAPTISNSQVVPPTQGGGKYRPKSEVSTALRSLTIIAACIFVVLASITLGHFGSTYNPQGQATQISCTTSSSLYSCSVPKINSTGQLSLVMIQNSGSTYYNARFACTQAASSAGLPVPGVTWYNFTTLTRMKGSNVDNSGQVATLHGLQCFSADGKAMNDMRPGTSFYGSVWINYTLESGSTNQSNPWNVQQIAAISAQVS